jgi:hypothetical protein
MTYFYSSGDPANLRNRELRTREKRRMGVWKHYVVHCVLQTADSNRMISLTCSYALYKRSQDICRASFMAFHILAHRHFKTSNDASWLLSIYFNNERSYS